MKVDKSELTLYSRIFYLLAVCAVVALAGRLRLRAVDRLPIDYDEDDYLRSAQLIAAEIQEQNWAGLQETNYRQEHPQLVKIAYGLAIAPLDRASLIPDQPTSASPAPRLPEPHYQIARKLSALFGSLEVLALAVLNPLAGLFLSIHTFTIKYHSQIMLEGLPSLTSALTVIFYMRAKNKLGMPIPNLWLLGSALFLGLTASGKYLFAIVGIVILADGLITAFHKRSWSPVVILLGWGLLSLVFFFASSPYLWPDPIFRLKESLLFHRQYASTAQEVQAAGMPPWQPFIWLFGSVPWHPGVFTVCLDLIITVFALLGFRSLWRERRLFALWIIIALAFLLIWPTKWPQYILILTFPWSLSASYGIRDSVWKPLIAWRGAYKQKTKMPASYSNLWRAALMLLPAGLAITAITFYPLFFQGAMAFTDFSAQSLRDGLNGGIWREFFRGISMQVPPSEIDISPFASNQAVRYVGLAWLEGVYARTPDLVFFNLMWAMLAVLLQIGLGIGTALLLSQNKLRLKQFWMVLFILPWAIPEFVGALSWLQILHPQNGWFALSGRSFGEIPGNPFAAAVATWQSNPLSVLLVLLVVGVWMGFPVMMLATIAGLKTIPRDIYDAAAMDGASGWALFWQIIWPMVLPLLAPVIILRMITAFNQFYLFYVLNPPFGMATFSLVSYFYVKEIGLYSASAALNIFNILILIVMLLYFNRVSGANKGVQYV
ncbi:MAG: sugar ABC transporter permease [Anaerolineales bacterium]|nr:sugar ABC transporter permease [Anaerolineales bacterium]